MRHRIAAVLLASVLHAAASYGQVDPPKHPLWGDLEPGPHPVGFTSWFELDASRTYQMTFADGQRYADDRAPRPILINLWYPAAEGEADDAEPMPYGGYLELASQDERLARFAAALTTYERNTIATELFGKNERVLPPAERKQLEKLLATATACVRDAEPAEQQFPLLIYHAGYGSSYEDNAVLCEYLASHGYFVAGSAFEAADGNSFNIDAHDGTASDVDLMIATLRSRAGVDAEHVGMVGHSGGAHASLRQQAREHSALAAVVSLDTTQDYYSNLDPRWSDVTTPVLAHPERMTVPILFCANPHACFALADTLKDAERWYLTVKLGHNDFITQGVLHAELACERVPADAAARAAAQRVRADYSSLCRCVRTFLDAHLKQDHAARERLVNDARRDVPLETGPHLELVPKGATGPAPYSSAAANGPPKPRQVRPLLAASGADATIAVLRRWHATHASAPIYDPIFGFALVYELSERGREAEARQLGALYRELAPELAAHFQAIGDRYARLGLNEFAARCFACLLLVDPENAEASRRLAELTGARR